MRRFSWEDVYVRLRNGDILIAKLRFEDSGIFYHYDLLYSFHATLPANYICDKKPVTLEEIKQTTETLSHPVEEIIFLASIGCYRLKKCKDQK